MYDPIMRVFTLLEILQGRDRVSGLELAQRLEVDLRTVQRYIVRLKDLNIPVDSSPGVGGAYRLRPGFRLPPLLLTNEEAFALSLGLSALRQVGLAGFAPATEGALAKLGRVLPESLRESIRTVEAVVAVEPGPWVAPTSVECLTGAATAIRTGRRVRFGYRSHHDAFSQREIEPYAVLHTDGRWYLIGRCLSRQALRTFRLDRATQLEVCSAGFTPPEDFDPRRYMADHMPFVQSNYQVDVWIDMPLEEAERSFAFWRIAMEASDGGTRLRCGRDRLEMFAAMLLSVGRRVVVYRPEELRETFRLLARHALQAADSPRS
ncbi:Predicted DNA-binding transcriptional regulator YafY, contains an HTH and WYL domains [Granulicella rosea]|uniref:Predicted DNA-binding transcriptional regulator YafY, contains an HTH and WYL domains n=1 Tax=Granulicella rosea TaxID=474952 RepID=A0A239HX39_9BACT|nr:YafY family protein [Granulicella rosea]SNS85842.1 Predicted DNA-binding transcriptional regulator YafY, contains an HTH and WYL domains [Granulicella rosea]